MVKALPKSKSLTGMMYRILLFLSIVLMPALARANAIQVTNLTVDQASGTVTFDLSWQNSWRVTTVPFNWDAAWVFVKFRECGVAPTTPWSHGVMSTTVGDHSFGSSLEPILSDGSATGIDAAPNNLGVMLRQNTAGIYPNTGPHTITLRVNNLPPTGTDIDVKVFGIEMVFIPEETYNLGDGSSTYAFSPTSVSSEAALTVLGSVNLPAAYPKGYAAFHTMKYEVSHGQYAEFLNTVSSNAQVALYPSENNYRHRLFNTGTPPQTYTTDRENRSVNYVDWDHLAAYLDWAALRPMTELEYEKICRGTGPVIVQEYAWGSTSITNSTTISTTIPPEDGTEIIINTGANVNYSNTNHSGGDGGRGPLRNGIFALPTTATRAAAGATFYGVLEMSGNVAEMVVPASNNASTYTGSLGDGAIDETNGTHNQADWPAPGTWDTGANNNRFQGYRGGSFNDNDDRLRVSDRYDCYRNSWTYDYERGGRGIR